MTTTTTYTIQKVKKGTNLPYYGLKLTDFILPFPYYQTSDVVVAMRGSLNNVDSDDILLVEGQHYTINGSVLRLNEQELGLDISDSLSVVLNATRNTNLNLAVYSPGHPVKAQDLNYNFNQLVFKIEENASLIKNNTYVSDTAPTPPYKGQTWLRTPYYVHYIFDGSSWVQPQ